MSPRLPPFPWFKPAHAAALAVRHWLLHSQQLTGAAVLLALLAVLVAAFSLAAAAGNNPNWAEHYNTLLTINVLMIVALLMIVASLFGRLLFRLKKARFGARLTLKFASAFALVGLLPGLLVYLVSVLFLSQSIDSWFNVKVDAALDAGLELSRSAINTQLQALLEKTRTAAPTVDSRFELGAQAQRIRSQFSPVGGGLLNGLDVLFFDADGRVLASTGSLASRGLLSDTPTGADMAALKRTGYFSRVESIPSADGAADSERLHLRAVVQVPAPIYERFNAVMWPTFYVQLSQALPAKLSALTQSMARGSKDYEALALGRTGIRKIYGATLTIIMLLSVLAAIATGFVLADAMSAPLLRLARGTQAVASGDFTPLPEPKGRDDLSVLTRSFNRMLTELGTARGALTRSKLYLEQVMASLSTGVMVLDAQQMLRSVNPSALAILGIKQPSLVGSAQAQLPQALWQTIAAQDASKTWQLQTEHTPAGGQTQTLLLRGAPIAQDDGEGLLLVFDDVSEVMLAQKAQAWSEVARRLAHEIKNPLTPIQLSAERLAMKLGDKLSGSDADLLRRGTATIVTQVAALKNMVDEFRQYARMPQANLLEMSLNTTLRDVGMLYKGKLIVVLDAAGDRILGDADQLRQVVHNLVGNALDAALAKHPAAEHGAHGLAEHAGAVAQVQLRTHNSEQGLHLTITDNGAGFSAQALGKLFEPYHTTKAQGTGLGLAIVHRIVQDHKAKIKVYNLYHAAADSGIHSIHSPADIIGAAAEIIFTVHTPPPQQTQLL
jgi:nitrogen fixation/metabolism regulation signal transduction histidine kinase